MIIYQNSYRIIKDGHRMFRDHPYRIAAMDNYETELIAGITLRASRI